MASQISSLIPSQNLRSMTLKSRPSYSNRKQKEGRDRYLSDQNWILQIFFFLDLRERLLYIISNLEDWKMEILPVMAAVAVRKKVVSIGYFSPYFCLQSLKFLLFVTSNQKQLYVLIALKITEK